MQYPEPRGAVYLCLSLQWISAKEDLRWLTRAVVEGVRTQTNPDALHGAPMLVTWLDVCAAARVV